MSTRDTLDADCLFCKIVLGEVSATVVHRTHATVAFRDIKPQAPTHVLIVPTAHIPDVATLAAADPPLLAALFGTAAEVAKSEGIAEGGYRTLFNTGRDAGQTVFHAHLHLLGGGWLGALAGGSPAEAGDG
jgi:histidine triad (HIT) family protein